MAPQFTPAAQTSLQDEDDVGIQWESRVQRILTGLQVVYFHAGSKLSYRRVQSTSGGKGSFTSIPVIDISQIDSLSPDDRRAIARQLYDACSTSGFFYIANHGVCLPGPLPEANWLANSMSGPRARAKGDIRRYEVVFRPRPQG